VQLLKNLTSGFVSSVKSTLQEGTITVCCVRKKMWSVQRSTVKSQAKKECRLQLLMAITSTVIFGSDSRRIHVQILLSQIRDSPNMEGQVPVFISPRNRMAQLYPRHWVSHFVASYYSLGYSGGIRTRLHTGTD
jgi:hypothetical protein